MDSGTSRQEAPNHVGGPPRDLVGYGRNVPSVEWPDGARLALSLVLNYEEGSEYNFLDGDGRNEPHGVTYPFPEGVRNLRVESNYEYGSRAGIWRLLRLFDEHQIRVTFHAAAVALERNRAVADAISEYGHEPCSHGWRWEEAWALSREEERQRIVAAVESILATCGERPVGWYDRYGPSVNTRELLVEEGGFKYDSNAYNDDLPYFTEVGGRTHLVLPYSATYNDGRFVGIPRFSAPSDFAEACKRGIKYLWEEGSTHPKMMSIGLHSRLIGEPARTHALREVIEYALELGDVWFARRIDIAEWCHERREMFTPRSDSSESGD